jgi:hypothetical protein
METPSNGTGLPDTQAAWCAVTWEAAKQSSLGPGNSRFSSPLPQAACDPRFGPGRREKRGA